MAAIASFSVARENGQCQQTRRPWKPKGLYTRFQGNYEKKVKKKISRQVAAILIIGGKLKM